MARPRKPPTEHALNPWLYSMVAAELAYKHVRRMRQSYQRPRWVWADLLIQLFDIAFDNLMMLCRRYDGRGTPTGYLHTFLPQHSIIRLLKAMSKSWVSRSAQTQRGRWQVRRTRRTCL